MRFKLAGLVVAASGLLAAQGAFAADLPTKAPVTKAPMAAGVPWTGFYVNGGIGYGMWAADTTTVLASGACRVCFTEVQGGKGWLGTIGAGYDYQFTNRIVAGLFGDASLSSLKGTIQDGQAFVAGDIKQTSSWAIGVRGGWVISPGTLSYMNAGYAGARFSGANLNLTLAPFTQASSTSAFTASGWFLGGGFETSVAPNWFWRNEYRYSYYGSKSLPATNTAGALVETGSFKPTVQTVTTQIVYKFNGGLPAPVYPGLPVKATNWTGIYANAGMGYGIWAADTTVVTPVTGVCFICGTQTQGGKGYLGVVGAGYDWQFAPVWVAGVFGDYNISSLKGTIQDQQGTGPAAIAGNIKQTSAWAAGARVGWLANAETLTYANGGYTSARFSSADMYTVAGAATGFSTPATTFSGWFVGGGVETTFDLLGMLGKGWFWRNEYRYASYGSKTLTDTNAAGATLNSITFKPVVQTVTSSVIFKLN
jgi:outer membrane immunogenic protein